MSDFTIDTYEKSPVFIYPDTLIWRGMVISRDWSVDLWSERKWRDKVIYDSLRANGMIDPMEDEQAQDE